MEIYTFRHKETKELIHFNKINLNGDIGTEYYFSDFELFPLWISNKLEDLEYIQRVKIVSSIHSVFSNLPSTHYINIDDYEIVKFENI